VNVPVVTSADIRNHVVLVIRHESIDILGGIVVVTYLEGCWTHYGKGEKKKSGRGRERALDIDFFH
jgi:hypothetical protein